MALLIVVVVAAVLIVAISVVGRVTQAPTRVAKRRLEGQQRALRAELASLPVHDAQLPATQEQLARAEWVRVQLRATKIDELDVPGVGDAMLAALRKAGFRSADDLPRLRPGLVPSVAEKRCADLHAAYDERLAQLRREGANLSFDALDAFTQGALKKTIEAHHAAVLAHARESEWIKLRLAELQRRHSSIV